jgi:hypothetical protein
MSGKRYNRQLDPQAGPRAKLKVGFSVRLEKMRNRILCRNQLLPSGREEMATCLGATWNEQL